MTKVAKNTGNTGATAPVAYEQLSQEELVKLLIGKDADIAKLSSDLEVAAKTNEELAEVNESLSVANQTKTTIFTIGKEKFKLKVKSFWFKNNGTMTKVTEEALLEDKTLLEAVKKRGDYLIPIK